MENSNDFYIQMTSELVMQVINIGMRVPFHVAYEIRDMKPINGDNGKDYIYYDYRMYLYCNGKIVCSDYLMELVNNSISSYYEPTIRRYPGKALYMIVDEIKLSHEWLVQQDINHKTHVFDQKFTVFAGKTPVNGMIIDERYQYLMYRDNRLLLEGPYKKLYSHGKWCDGIEKNGWIKNGWYFKNALLAHYY